MSDTNASTNGHVKPFLLDTIVLLHKPSALFRFVDNETVSPFDGIEELDKFKTNTDDLGRNARTVIRHLDRMRKRGNLSEGVPIEQTGGHVRVILEEDQKLCPGLTINTPDNRIICTAFQLHQDGKRVVFISKDINARIKSDALGLVTEDFEAQKVDFERLYDDIRECIDTVHRDNSLKREIRKDIGHYIFKDPELGPALHKLRSGGKKLFLLTNSLWDYTDVVMSYLLDGVVAEYPFWRNYFDLVVTGASKPAFFSELRPFQELDLVTGEGKALGENAPLERGKVYQGGNQPAFQRATSCPGEAVLYVGDHIYGDILRSKKSSLWRTCMVVQEIEDEINYTDARHVKISALSEVELLLARLDDEVSARKTALNQLERKKPVAEEERRRLKGELERLRRAHRESFDLSESLERDVEEGFNRYWGLLFKEGNENSRFGEQVEQYACIYTSRVSNLLHYSPMQYYRSPRDLMPHERAGALSGKLSPLGSEGPPRGWRKEG